jgi:hypothetical protein
MEKSWWRDLPPALRSPIVIVGLACGVTATGLAVIVGLTTAGALMHPGCGSKVKLAFMRARAGHDAIERFVIDRGRCPSSHQVLVTERYLDEINLRDPWGTHIELGCAAAGDDLVVTAWSAGPDRAFGTSDDIQAD